MCEYSVSGVVCLSLVLGRVPEEESPVEGSWVDLVVGLENFRCEIVMMRMPDGHGAELVGQIARDEEMYRLCYVRGPEGIIVGLVEELE